MTNLSAELVLEMKKRHDAILAETLKPGRAWMFRSDLQVFIVVMHGEKAIVYSYHETIHPE